MERQLFLITRRYRIGSEPADLGVDQRHGRSRDCQVPIGADVPLRRLFTFGIIAFTFHPFLLHRNRPIRFRLYNFGRSNIILNPFSVVFTWTLCPS